MNNTVPDSIFLLIFEYNDGIDSGDVILYAFTDEGKAKKFVKTMAMGHKERLIERKCPDVRQELQRYRNSFRIKKVLVHE